MSEPPRAPRGSVTLIVPTYNEITGMRAIMPQIRPEWCDQIIVVDAGSTDGTQDYARAQGYELVMQKTPGLRAAYVEAFSHARGDIVVTFSPDGNSLPELIPALVDKVDGGYDMVIASRYAPGAKSDDDDWLTAFGNWFFTRLINLCFRAQYTDSIVMFRAYRTKLFLELELDRDEGYAMEKLFLTTIGVEPLLSIRAAKRGLKVCDIPGDEPARLGGARKLLPFRWGAAFLLQIAREMYYWRR